MFYWYNSIMSDVDIFKSAGVIIQNRQALIVRPHHKDIFIQPGGKIEAGESAIQALIRELAEELQIQVKPRDLEFLHESNAPAAGQTHRIVHMQVYLVKAWKGNIAPANEIAELRWINADFDPNLELGSIMAHDTLPRLKAMDLID